MMDDGASVDPRSRYKDSWVEPLAQGREIEFLAFGMKSVWKEF